MKFLSCAILSFALCCLLSINQINAMDKPDYEALFKLVENASNDTFKAQIILTNHTENDLKEWKLCMDFIRPFTINKSSLNKVKVTKVIGEYVEIEGLQPIPSKQSITFDLDGKWFVKKYTDTPSIYFIVTPDGRIHEVSGSADMGGFKPPELKEVKELEERSLSASSIKLIPAPQKVELKEGIHDFSKESLIAVDYNNKDARKALRAFRKNYSKLIPNSLRIKSVKPEKGPYISLVYDNSIPAEAYNLDISQNSVEIKASSRSGFFYGIVSFFKLVNAYDNQVPCMKITDSPRFAYRGALLDTARNFKSAHEVRKFIKMLALYKINVFHWHLTDDEGWRIEIKKYPNLTNIGAFRGYGEIIPPLCGSSFDKTGGYYTQEEISKIIKLANDLNITIIPEVDIPGHARALIVSFDNFKNGKNPLVEIEDKSKYTSNQLFNDNVLNPAIDDTYEILDNIFSETLPLFAVQQPDMPFSKYVHIGCDEVPQGVWINSPECLKLMKSENLKSIQQLQHYFVCRVQKIAEQYGYKIAGWEEIAKGGDFTTSSDASANLPMVFSWQGEEAGLEAAEKGFTVVMTPAQYVYFDLAYTPALDEPGYYWAGYINPKVIYSYNPVTDNMGDKVKKNIVGVQGCLWGDSLVKPRVVNRSKLPENFLASPVQYLAYPKITAFSEVAWSPMSARSWKNFVKNYESERKILDLFKVKYRTEPIE